MATMATTSHGLSVYVNSCIKNPLDSRTGSSTTFAERQSKLSTLAATDPGPYIEFGNDFDDEEREELGGSLPAPATIQDVETQLKNLTDEQFYLKLQQLKHANRKTLEECEKLYKAKYKDDDQAADGLSAKEMVEEMFAARLAERSGHVDSSTSSVHLAATVSNGAPPRDRVRDMTAKPPRVPLGHTSPVRSSGIPNRSSRPRPQSASPRGQLSRRAYSLDDEDWRNAMHDSADISDEEIRSEGNMDPEFIAAVTKIRNMWQGFRIDDYSSQERRHSSASQAKKKNRRGGGDIAENWRHRITIPKPFMMTMRDAEKTSKKTRAQQELEEKRLEKKLLEEEECQKKFKAQPAPAHIYLPLYDEIKEKNETRRRQVKQYCQELLKSQEKPFNFFKREEEKKKQRAQSATVAERIARSAEKARKKEAQFVAKPVPDFIYDNTPTQKLLEEEEYRKIRIKMRARELLKEASLPPNMELHEKMREQREKEKLMKANQNNSGRRKRTSHRIPDYDFLYREFQKELARRKHSKEATVVEPFEMETNRVQRDRVKRDMERDDKLMRDTAKRTPRLGAMSSSMDSIPFMSTASADLRTGYKRSQQTREARRQEEREEEERRKHARELRLRKYMMERGADTPRVDDKVKERLKKHRESDMARLEQYEKDLEEMKNRVEKRPMLFERETQLSAGKAAERKFKSTLKSAGIDEDFLKTRSSGASGTRSNYDGEDEEGADNLTFTKTAYHREEELVS